MLFEGLKRSSRESVTSQDPRSHGVVEGRWVMESTLRWTVETQAEENDGKSGDRMQGHFPEAVRLSPVSQEGYMSGLGVSSVCWKETRLMGTYLMC